MNFNLPNALPVTLLRVVTGFAGILFAVSAAADDTNAGLQELTPAMVGERSPNLATDPVANSVVKIFSTVRYPDFYKPWSKQAPADVTGSGVVIDGKRILTCAHVVLYAGQVQIQANQSGDKIPAKIEAVAPGMDLAVLKLDDETFFDTHHPLARAKTLPQIRDMVMAYGYPLGGASLSITKGIVSRIEFAVYNYPDSGLRMQVDAAINPGNSGGPAVVGEKMVGLAFSRLGGSAENIGYIIPCEEIDLFLRGLDSGHYDGKPMFFDDCQALNAPLRSFLKLTNSAQGVIVNRIADPDDNYPLKKWDLITKIGDAPIDDLGMVNLDGGLRVFFKYICQRAAQNGKVPLTVVRAGKTIQIDLPLRNDRPMLIPLTQGTYPSYFIFGPMVFSAATAEFVTGFSSGNAGAARLALLGYSGSPLVTRIGDIPAFPGEQLVVVSSPFFPHRLTQDYSDPFSDVVKTVNGIPVKNLNHLVQILRDSKDEFITFEFCGHNRQIVALPRAEILAATDEILTDNGVRTQGSADTMAVWNAKSGATK